MTPIQPNPAPPSGLAGAGGGGGGTVSAAENPLASYLPIIARILEQSKMRKQRAAEEAVSLIPAGTKWEDLSPQQQQAYKRATGVMLKPGQDVVPLPPSPLTSFDETLKKLGIPPDSTAGMGLRTALVRREATGQASGPTTQSAIAAETGTADDVATAERIQAGQFKTATQKVAAAAPGATASLTEGEDAAYQHFNNFIPSESVAKDLTAQTTAEVMKQALRVAAHPDSASWASLLPPDVKPSDVIGGIALGVGGIIESGVERKNIIATHAATTAIDAITRVATKVSEDMHGAYSPDDVKAVMSGDPKMLKTPAGQMILRFMQAGFLAGITQASGKGSATLTARLLTLARDPKIASDQSLLSSYSNAMQEQWVSENTRALMGRDRNPAGDPEWDQVADSFRKQTLGVFKSGVGGILGIGSHMTITPNAPSAAAQGDTTSSDAKLLEQSLRALFPDSTAIVMPPKPGAGGRF